jgi:hypothetical protein
MREIICIEFSAQDEKETLKAIDLAKQYKEEKRLCRLIPTENLISTRCLKLLDEFVFTYNEYFVLRG